MEQHESTTTTTDKPSFVIEAARQGPADGVIPVLIPSYPSLSS